MSNAYTRDLSTIVPQGERVDSRQVRNNAGGYTFSVNEKTRLERFLILGTDGGSYYVSEQNLTKQNTEFLIDLIHTNSELVVDCIFDVSVNGRAYKNSAAIFTLALVFKHGDNAAKDLARKALPKICRTSTHLFEFAQYIELMGGWGRAKRSAIAAWYQAHKNLSELAYQAVKYRQRGGWAHADLLRLTHARVDPAIERFVRRWYKPEQNMGTIVDNRPELNIIRAYEELQGQTSLRGILNILDQDYAVNCPWEALPTQFLTVPEVWKKLFHNGQLQGQALVRNITRLARIDAFKDMVFAREYADRLTNPEMIRKTRLHPINFLNASIVYSDGQVRRDGSFSREKTWTTNSIILDALNDGFYSAFTFLEPSHKKTLVCLDVSGSMWWETSMCNGLDIEAATAAAAMSMAIARTEPYYQVCAFSDTMSDRMKEINISKSMSLGEVNRTMQSVGYGGTDCSLPMTWALENKIEVQTFSLWTDNETWYGSIHPHMALQKYRREMGIDAKLVVAGVSATEFSIADPTDNKMLDVVGFDSNAPKVIADFSAGRF